MPNGDFNTEDYKGFSIKELLMFIAAKQDQIIADHENRIRALERFRYALPGTAAIAAIVAIGLGVFSLVTG